MSLNHMSNMKVWKRKIFMLCLPKNSKTFDTISGSLMDLYAITIRKTITASNLNLSGATILSRAAIKNKMLRNVVCLFLSPPMQKYNYLIFCNISFLLKRREDKDELMQILE